MSVMAMAVEPDLVGGPFTRADLENTPNDGRRYELIDGVLIVSAAPGLVHQEAAGRLFVALYHAAPQGFRVLVGPYAVGLAEDTEIQPDIIVGHRDDFTEREITTPLLAIEVLSPSTRLFDTHVKRARLERAGVPSYWVIDPVVRSAEAAIVAWELDERGRYRQAANVVGEGRLKTDTP